MIEKVRGHDSFWGVPRTAWTEYCHPSGHRVILLGCVHMAPENYYRYLNELMLNYVHDGFVVLYERVGDPSPEKLAQASDEERDLLARYRLADRSIRRTLNDICGMHLQGEWYGMDENWRNTDLDCLDLIRGYGEGAAERSIKTINTAVDFLEKSPKWTRSFYKALLMTLITNAGLVMRIADKMFEKYPSLRSELAHDVILDERNQIVIDAALAETRNVVLPWGAHHHGGMAATLEEKGYKLIGHTMISTRQSSSG